MNERRVNGHRILPKRAGTVGNTVEVAADRHEAVVTDAALELQDRLKPVRRQGLQFGLLGSISLGDDALGGAVHPDIRDAIEPFDELCVQVVEIAEGSSEEEVLANVAEWPLDLSLRFRTVGPAGAWLER